MEMSQIHQELTDLYNNLSKLRSRDNDNLTADEIKRYSRQILVPNIGVEGQLKLKSSSVLVVGAGGLGCPALSYLAGSGIGHIGIIDYDVVELNNLHRQVLHTTESVGTSKAESAAKAIKRLNENVIVTVLNVALTGENALPIVKCFDVVIDATDNVPTRYLLNDACVLSGKPLVSGSALKMEGQLTVYHYENGPCYRCIFAVPPLPDTVTNCDEAGVLGPVPGVIGVQQALEAIKIILKQKTLSGTLLLFDGIEGSFLSLKLRGRQPGCSVCGLNPEIKELIDYEVFCQSKSTDKNPDLKLLPVEKRVTVGEYLRLKTSPHVLIDVRKEDEFKICRLEGSVNIPLSKIKSKDGFRTVWNEIEGVKWKLPPFETFFDVPVFVICRRGNDSQQAVLALENKITGVNARDIIGGLHAWANEIDPNFPVY